MEADQPHITTAEAAKLTRHASRQTFLRWAHRHAPEVLIRPPGFRDYLVDRAALRRVIWGDWCEQSNTDGSNGTQADSCTGNT